VSPVADIAKRSKPVIYQVGNVQRTGPRVRVYGWGLTYCYRRCSCHVSPHTFGCVLQEGANGSLGLQKYAVCSCCEPWTAVELEYIVRELNAIENLGTTVDELPS
jgi:hypothetical protein